MIFFHCQTQMNQGIYPGSEYELIELEWNMKQSKLKVINWLLMIKF